MSGDIFSGQKERNNWFVTSWCQWIFKKMHLFYCAPIPYNIPYLDRGIDCREGVIFFLLLSMSQFWKIRFQSIWWLLCKRKSIGNDRDTRITGNTQLYSVIFSSCIFQPLWWSLNKSFWLTHWQVCVPIKSLAANSGLASRLFFSDKLQNLIQKVRKINQF